VTILDDAWVSEIDNRMSLEVMRNEVKDWFNENGDDDDDDDDDEVISYVNSR